MALTLDQLMVLAKAAAREDTEGVLHRLLTTYLDGKPPVTSAEDCTVVLLDIEGTTTTIPFVHEVLFPYARRLLPTHVEQEWSSLGSTVEELQVLSKAEGPTWELPDYSSPECRGKVVAYLEHLMDDDRKVAPLKALQGDMWRAGYASGELKGQVFDDVQPALERWKRQGRRVYIYSSGSVAAQKLLFGHSERGDLLPHIDGHFDTKVGPKKESGSYTQIASNIDVPPEKILFLTDAIDEAVAAREAKMTVFLSVRPQNHPLTPAQVDTAVQFPCVRDFTQIFPDDQPPVKRARRTE